MATAWFEPSSAGSLLQQYSPDGKGARRRGNATTTGTERRRSRKGRQGALGQPKTTKVTVWAGQEREACGAGGLLVIVLVGLTCLLWLVAWARDVSASARTLKP